MASVNRTDIEHAKEPEFIAVEALSQLCNSNAKTDEIKDNSHGEEKQEDKQHYDDGETLLHKMRQNSIINNAVSLYEQTKLQHPNFKRRVELVERKASTMVRRTSEFWSQADSSENDCMDDVYSTGTPLDDHLGTPLRVSKRQKIRENFKEYRLNMSIESKKQLITCLHLLKLANKQLSHTVSSLQDLVQKEKETAEQHLPHKDSDSDDNEQFYDASENLADERSKEIKMEVVGTVKKVYSLISHFAGNSLPEPARSQVRETLLNLPTNWSLNVNSTSKQRSSNPRLSANGKILILAEESLDMVSNVIQVFDGTIGKAEEWVKHKRELKELIKAQYIETQLKLKVKRQLEKEQAEGQHQELNHESI
ncbi:transcriptional regulator OPI1 Ecym_4590 [Eremothecium cymbalariae DBVPG|uniref:Transcriptional repressor OPI1 n=1 Tax=Eremothecium cymbalariae (strain CBS 270.75 / DBVPG 7215 / KCTC 17166 / NRRL Y-17582) TaxID=931890 RepID=G8JSA0_ERECY|nr:hypothetical protein Ecym_4590 [Eremothecium cymbalariae DBVPG\